VYLFVLCFTASPSVVFLSLGVAWMSGLRPQSCHLSADECKDIPGFSFLPEPAFECFKFTVVTNGSSSEAGVSPISLHLILED
jgi:hypothetical protein